MSLNPIEMSFNKKFPILALSGGVGGVKLIQGFTKILSPDQLHQMAFEKFIHNSIEDDSLKIYLENTRELYKKISDETVDLIKKHLNSSKFSQQLVCVLVCRENDKIKFIPIFADNIQVEIKTEFEKIFS